MTDYHPLIARAVAGLEKNTGEARRALYERARTALLAQLRSAEPPLSESEITRERLGLEEAIRRVESEAARRPRYEPKPDLVAKARPGAIDRRDESSDRPNWAAPNRDRSLAAPPEPFDPAAEPQERQRLMQERPPQPPNQGTPGFRDVVAEAEGLGEATAHAARSAREVFAQVPASDESFERMEPRVEPEGLRTPARSGAAGRAGDAPPDLGAPPPLRPKPRRAEPRKGRGIGSNVLPVLVILAVLLTLGGVAYWQRERIGAIFSLFQGSSSPTKRDAPPATSQPKISDRVGQPGQAEPQQGAQVAPVAQRVVLYEEDPAETGGKQYVGSAVWRTETASPGQGLPPELVVRCDVEIPERRMTMTMSIRRNTDQALPASHTIEIMFNLPPDFPSGGISNVPGVLMKQQEQTRGAPLAGLAVKVTAGFFLVGLSAVDSDLQRNLQLLKERAWFDIPIVYNNGRRAILAIEKGTPGERAFQEAFSSWGQ